MRRPIFGYSALLLGIVACDTGEVTAPAGSPTLPALLVSASSAPTLLSASFVGGAGDQRGLAAATESGAIYAAGFDQVAGLHGLLVKFDTPPAIPAWSVVTPNVHFNGLALHPGAPHPVGQAAPPTCGASDGAGDTERKTLLARYDGAGSLLGCRSENFFPYRGIEYYLAGLPTTEGGNPFVYAAGQAEQTGFAASFPFVLAKYDGGGNFVAAVTEPGITLGSFTGCCPGESNVQGLTQMGGDLYLAGYSRLPGLGEADNTIRPVLMRYGTSPLARIWKARSADVAGRLHGVVPLSGELYAVGYSGSPPSRDFLMQKYDASGVRVWSLTTGGAGDDLLTGVSAVGTRLFAVGHSSSGGAGGVDGVVLELDPATGATLTTTYLGGALDDLANGVTTDGVDLYVVGESRSFASADGNLVGQNDLVLWSLALLLEVEIDILPGSATNPINPKNKGVVPVAVLSTADFDATTDVDRSTLTFGRTGDEASFSHCALVQSDLNGDALVDLLCYFHQQATGFVSGDTQGVLRGATTAGQPIEGADVVRVR